MILTITLKSNISSLHFFFEPQDFKYESDVWENIILDRFCFTFQIRGIEHSNFRSYRYLGKHLAPFCLGKDKEPRPRGQATSLGPSRASLGLLCKLGLMLVQYKAIREVKSAIR